MRLARLTIITYFALLLAQTAPSANAQQSSQLENMLNKVDAPSSWSQIPASGMPSQQQQQMQYAQPLANPTFAQPQQQMQYAQPLANPTFAQPQQLNQPNNAFTGRQQLLRMLLDGSAPTNSLTGNNKWGSSNAYSDWQEAENQASRAYNAEQRAMYEKDKGNRESDASEAYYAANESRSASDRVYQASLNGDPTAKQYAAKARAAADRARDNSDKARYYADTGN